VCTIFDEDDPLCIEIFEVYFFLIKAIPTPKDRDAMPDQHIETAYRLFTWRILSNKIPPWEFEQIKSKLEKWEDWCRAWCEVGEKFAKLGDEALASNRRLSAGESFVTAASFYHFASFLFTHDQDQFRAALNAMDTCWQKAAPLLDPPMELVQIPFEGIHLPGYLRKPAGVERPPIVILAPGGDSTKEELYDFSETILKRGLATLVFDGPGHGAVSFQMKMRPDFEVPARAIVDFVMDREDLDTNRLAFGGVSYGGMFACRAAAFDDRIRAIFVSSGWYSPAGRFSSMAAISQIALKQYFGENAAEVQNSMTLADVANRIKVPLLQIYGGLDKASPPEHAYRVEKEVHGPTTTLVFEDGVHSCNNLHYIVRPLVADWLAETI
jgi:pimeloyl-ACP methyl ester carboxylesterase